MIPHRHLQRLSQRDLQNDRIPSQSERDYFQESTVSGALAGIAGLEMNMPSLQAALNNDTDNNILSQQIRLYQANQDLLLAARREQEGLSLARQNFNPHQGLQNNVPPQLFNHMNQFGTLQRMELKTNNAPFQTDSILTEAYQRGKEEVLRSLLQGRNIDSHNMVIPVQRMAGVHMPQDTLDTITDRKDPCSQALEALGTTSIQRRKKNSPYFDASSLKDPDPVDLASRRTRGGVTEPFPEKLHRMLREVENNDQGDIISFLGHGRAFTIHNPDKFCKGVMPNYFKQSRLSSFQRQLNLYGFSRVTNGPDAGGYYHELFLKGRPALAVHMRRVGVTSATSNHRSIRPTGNTPDFYNMLPVQGAAACTEASAKNDVGAESA